MQTIVPLTEYQRAGIGDRARFRFRLQARQTGKSFGESLDGVLNAIERRQNWVWLSAGERQSKELIEKGATHARAIGAAVSVLTEEYAVDEGRFTSHVLQLPGAKITGLPANPATARGHSANVLLDEFAFHRDSRAIWTALFPTITRGYRLTICTTPQGKTNKAYDLWTDWAAKQAAGNAAYSCRRVTIYDAVAGGLVLRDDQGNATTPVQLKEALGDEEAWQQEYLCEFLDEAAAWLTFDQLAAVEDPELPIVPAPLAASLAAAEAAYRADRGNPEAIDRAAAEAIGGWIAADETGYLGLDIARRRDLSVLWLLRRETPTLVSVATLAMRNTPFAVQHAVLFAVLGSGGVRRACIDRSGLGLNLAEAAADRFGAWRVEGVDFSQANKEALAGRLRQTIEDRQVRIPAVPAIRASLHSIKRIPTTTGHFRFDAERSEATGHADHFWALALACQAASTLGAVIEHQASGQRRVAAGAYEAVGAGAGMTDAAFKVRGARVPAGAGSGRGASDGF
jgi:phage FluMu gp28-like protein